jgi:hypothetical protein
MSIIANKPTLLISIKNINKAQIVQRKVTKIISKC